MFSKTSIIKISILLSLFCSSAFASWNSVESEFNQRKRLSSKIPSLIVELTNQGYYFSALPWMKEYLIQSTKTLSSTMENSLSKIVKNVGVKQFETLPLRFLTRSKSNTIRYVVAKKHMRNQDYDKALIYLRRIPSSHSIYPFAKNMEASILSIVGKQAAAVSAFEACAETGLQGKVGSAENRKYKLNRDYCVVGKARAQFANRSFDNSELLYLDIPKSSAIWPEILFEEAWNSYYKKDYNRTLGKLVSYKAPVFDYIFNPEIEVLTALTYMNMCLYPDVKKIYTDFNNKYYKDTVKLRRFINRAKNKNSFFYNLMIRFEQRGDANSDLLVNLLKSIQREEAYKDIKAQLLQASKEYSSIRSRRNSRFKRAVVINLQESMRVQKSIMGAYIRGKLVSHYAKLYKAFEGMSYIRLEGLRRRKIKLYSFDDTKRSRGDLKYIQRNEKQYFWNFNGEFWADELGDYVFALKSEC